jgi:hypothetical protein
MYKNLSIFFFVILNFSLFAVDPKLDLPLDLRNQYAPNLLFAYPQVGSPILLDKGQFRFHSNVAYTSEIKNSQFYAIKDRPYIQNRLWYASALRRSNLTTQESIILADLINFGHLENQHKTIIDMEYANVQLKMEYGISEKIEVGIYSSILSFNSGVLDGPINLFHKLLTVQTGKEYLPTNKFEYTVSGSNTRVIHSKPRTNLGDTDLIIKYSLGNHFPMNIKIALNGGVKIPTGNTELGMSSGKFDAYGGAIIKSTSENISHFFQVQGVYISNPFNDLTLRSRSIGIISYNLNYFLTEKIFPSIRFDLHSSPYRSITGLLSQPSFLFSLGLNYSPTESTLIQIGFIEDLSYTVPDVTFFMNLKTLF